MSARHYPLAVVALLGALVSPAAGQATANQGAVSLSGGFDFVNAYLFRGLRQDDTNIIMWPYAEASIRLHSGNDAIRSVAVNVGTWNSLSTGLSGTAGPSNRLWYESDFYTTLALGFGGGFALGSTFTAYTSPNSSFSSIKELAFKVTVDDDGRYTGFALNPYALFALELDTSPGQGQADNGLHGGRYLEFGAAPAWENWDITFAFPIKVGLSIHDYYELAGVDHTFGFLSIGALGTLPIASSSRYGSWNIHGGAEFLSLGDTPEAFNGGDQTKFIASIGIGFSY